MYIEYIIETTVMYTWQASVIVACILLSIDTIKKWVKERKERD